MGGRARAKEPRGWTTDHAHAGGKSSMGIVLDWLTTPGNYERWRATASNKSALSGEIVQIMHQAGIFHRKPTDVYKKIYDMEKSFHKAVDQLRSARQQLLRSKGSPADPNLHRALVQHSRYFVLLQPVMGEHATADKRPKKRPLLTTRRTPPPTPTRPTESPKKKRKSTVARRKTPPRACNSKQSVKDWQSGVPEQKYKPSPKKQRLQEEDVDEDSFSYPWKTEDAIKTQAMADEDFKAALSAEIEMEKAQLELAMRRLEVQAARDEALIARVKARDELLEHGVPLRDVERLLPLDM